MPLSRDDTSAIIDQYDMILADASLLKMANEDESVAAWMAELRTARDLLASGDVDIVVADLNRDPNSVKSQGQQYGRTEIQENGRAKITIDRAVFAGTGDQELDRVLFHELFHAGDDLANPQHYSRQGELSDLTRKVSPTGAPWQAADAKATLSGVEIQRGEQLATAQAAIEGHAQMLDNLYGSAKDAVAANDEGSRRSGYQEFRQRANDLRPLREGPESTQWGQAVDRL